MYRYTDSSTRVYEGKNMRKTLLAIKTRRYAPPPYDTRYVCTRYQMYTTNSSQCVLREEGGALQLLLYVIADLSYEKWF